MGINSDIQKLASNAITKTAQKQYQKEYNDNLKYFQLNIKELLQLELIEDIKQNKNIFDSDYKYNIINNIIDAYFINNPKIKDKYKNDLQIYFISNYYNISNQSRLTYKKQCEQISQQNQLKNDILELKKQQEVEKLKKLQQQNAQNEQKYNMRQAQKQPTKQVYVNRSGNSGEVAKVLLYLMFAPIVIFGLVIYGFISCASKTK